MRVTDIRVTTADSSSTLTAYVTSEADPDGPYWFAPFALWYRFPAWCQPFLRADTGDPFLAALLLPAMMNGERLALSAAISPRLRRRLWDIQAVQISFDGRLRRIAVDAPDPATSPAGGEPPAASGLFFSLGVDSFYSLLKNERDHAGDEERVSHLVAIHGFHEPHGVWEDHFPPAVQANNERVAAETGRLLLPVVTNARLVTTPLARWNMNHGAVLASVALALPGLFDRVLIAASTTYDQLYPWGSHPVLDPLWSTERLEVVHDGCELGRIDKVRFIAGSQLVLDTLRVCPGFGGAYNCGQCIKCLPTMIDLMQVGALARSQAFPHDIDVAALREIFRAFAGQLNVDNYERRLHQLAEDAPAGLREALAAYVAAEKAPAATYAAPPLDRAPPGLMSRLFPGERP